MPGFRERLRYPAYFRAAVQAAVHIDANAIVFHAADASVVVHPALLRALPACRRVAIRVGCAHIYGDNVVSVNPAAGASAG